MNHGNKEHLTLARASDTRAAALDSFTPGGPAMDPTTGLVVAYVALEWISFIHESKGCR